MTLPEGLMRHVIDAYGLAPRAPAIPVSPRVWRLSIAGGDIALKRFGVDETARAASEAGILAHLGQQHDPRIRVQQLLRTRGGDDAITVDGCQLLLTRWDSGTFRSYDRIDHAGWQALGRGLGVLHAQLDALPGGHLDSLSARLQAIDARQEQQRLDAARARLPVHSDIGLHALHDHLDTCQAMLERHLSAAQARFPVDAPGHAIHNDYNQFNYLFTPGLAPLILDWEAAIGAPREFEVVRCLNHLPLQAPALAQAFIEAYLQVRPLVAARIAWAVDAALLMHARKHWLLDGWLQDPPAFQARLRGAIDMTALLSRSHAALLDFYTDRITGSA